jgi:hypothetical protein
MTPDRIKNNQYDINGKHLSPEFPTISVIHHFESRDEFLHSCFQHHNIPKSLFKILSYIIKNQRKDGSFNCLEHFKPLTELLGVNMGIVRKKLSELSSLRIYNHRVLVNSGLRNFEYKINPYFNFPKEKGNTFTIEYHF